MFWRILLTHPAYYSISLTLLVVVKCVIVLNIKLLSALQVRRPDKNTALNIRTEQYITSKISGNASKQRSKTLNGTTRQFTTVKTSTCANVLSNGGRAEKVCGWNGENPRLTL